MRANFNMASAVTSTPLSSPAQAGDQQALNETQCTVVHRNMF